ncbi:MAG: Ig-like domain-containing protein [Verrucomicrobiota bacterium]
MKNHLFSKGKALFLIVCTLGLGNGLLAQDAPPLPPVPPIPPAIDLPAVEILGTDPTALVGASSGAFTVVRSGSPTAALVVQYAISGTAVNGVDYSQIKSDVTIPAGFLATDIVIVPIGDSPNRGNRTIILTLQTNVNYRLREHKKATLNLVDDVFNNQAPVIALTSPADGTVFKLPDVVTLQATATDPDDTLLKVSFYANDRSLGRVTNSPYTLTWTNPPSGSYALFARAVDPLGKSTLSAPVHITVTNAPPVIKLLSPVDGSTVALPANVTVQADVTDSDDAVVKVQIYGDNKLLATLTKAPYSVVWTNVPPGKHSVTVRATDEFGVTAAASVEFSVVNNPPVVNLVKPTGGANFPAKSTITLEANASDTDGTITRVSFWASSRYLGAVSKAPYTLAWKNVPAGVDSLRAIATDNYGWKTESSKVLISISK